MDGLHLGEALQAVNGHGADHGDSMRECCSVDICW